MAAVLHGKVDGYSEYRSILNEEHMITATKVLEHVFVLKDKVECCANLVIGEKKALLFDTGSGIDDIKEAVRNLTKLPLIVMNSHGHFDHIGGNGQFDEVYLSELDFPIIEGYDIEMLNRWMGELTKGAVQPYLTAPKEWKCIRRLEFDSFDLGNLWCKIIALRGHTAGSIGIWIPSLGLLLSGDALTPVMCLNFQNHLSKEIQYETLVSVQSLEFDFYLTSHQDILFPKQIVQRLQSCIKNSDGKKFHFYQYPRPPYAKGWIYLDSLGEEPIALIISDEERTDSLL